jgi:hypothetical protein
MEVKMTSHDQTLMNSAIGEIAPDGDGSPIGLARVAPDKSYSGIGDLLQENINNSDQVTWRKIREKIDHTYEGIDSALEALKKETRFHIEIESRLEKGQKLLFKPNIVSPVCINPQSHDPGMGSTACTEWAFVAALMRWFHDKLKISYYQMAVGEASTMTSSIAAFFSMMNPDSQPITPEAVIEGKSGNFCGGWGFYFARKYLSESLERNAEDDPMKGYEESVAGTYIPFGLVSDKLLVYDLNRINDKETRGRKIGVSDGVNYKSITLHKAIIGGNKEDRDDLKANPGCILINVPKFKVHAISLFTNAIKNLGIGLYPMQFSSSGDHHWEYSNPHLPLSGMKGGLPHEVWVPDIDHETGLPKRDASGKYVVQKTGGITATMIDVIKAVKEQDIFMMHVVDGIEAINVDHQGIGLGLKVPEGMVFAGLDPVATDLLCARYMFSNVPLKEAMEADIDDGNGGHFPQAVPIPKLEGSNIISASGFDCPLSREELFANAEKRGLGVRKYYAVGFDSVSKEQFITIKGHLGTKKGRDFSDLYTATIFYDTFKFPWDMQKSALNYLEASDKLAGTSIKNEFLDSFDDDRDGVLTYKSFGTKGLWGTILHLAGDMVSKMGSDRFGYLKDRYCVYARMLKNSNILLNENGHDVLKEYFYGSACSAAFQISKLDMEFPDPFQPGLICGKGKWPSFQLAQFFQKGVIFYGQGYPYMVGFPSMYASALLYADLTQNGGQYAGQIWNKPNLEAINQYVEKAATKEVKPLQFTIYMPAGYDNLSGKVVPNVEITDDPAKILTAEFAGGKEIWPEARL